MSPTSYQTAPPRVKAGAEVYGRTRSRVNRRSSDKKARMERAFLFNWYRGGDSNPYSLWPLPPQGSVSTNSTTSAKSLVAYNLLLLWNLRYVSCFNSWLLFFEHRDVFDDRFFLHFHHRRVWQTYFGQTISFLFSKEC